MGEQTIKLLARMTPRYLGVSIFCYLFNNALLIGLDRSGVALWLAVLFSAASMILIGFALQALITFSVPLTRRAFGRYAIALAPNVPVAFALLWALHDAAGLAMHWASPLVTGLLFLWNGMGSIWALHRWNGPAQP